MLFNIRIHFILNKIVSYPHKLKRGFYIFSLLTWLSLSFYSLKAQSEIPTVNPNFFYTQKTSRVNLIDLTTLGRVFQDNSWNAGNIYLSNGDSLIAYYMRYDLIRKQLEIIVEKKIKGLRMREIDHFDWYSADRLQNEAFINSALLKFEIPFEKCFVQLLIDDTIKLIKTKEVFAKIRTSSPSLVVDHSFNQSNMNVTENYYFINNEMKTFEIGRSKRSNFKFINSNTLEDYVKQNNLSFNKEAELIQIFNYYLSILKNKNTPYK